jgi:hypothetical protein
MPVKLRKPKARKIVITDQILQAYADERTRAPGFRLYALCGVDLSAFGCFDRAEPPPDWFKQHPFKTLHWQRGQAFRQAIENEIARRKRRR